MINYTRVWFSSNKISSSCSVVGRCLPNPLCQSSWWTLPYPSAVWDFACLPHYETSSWAAVVSCLCLHTYIFGQYLTHSRCLINICLIEKSSGFLFPLPPGNPIVSLMYFSLCCRRKKERIGIREQQKTEQPNKRNCIPWPRKSGASAEAAKIECCKLYLTLP